MERSLENNQASTETQESRLLDEVRRSGEGQTVLERQEPPVRAQVVVVPEVSEAQLSQPLKPPKDLATERANLDSLAQANLRGGDLRKFQADMARLENRARTERVADSQVAEAYSEIARLLTPAHGFLSQSDRTRLARQVLQNAAEPTAINNGFHKTCNVTTIEGRTYTRYPEVAAKLVADVAINGSFTTADGSVIVPSAASLRPDDESRFDQPGDGKRNFASHVFQVTAVNVFWQRQTSDIRGNPVPKGSIQYEQLSNRARGDTGERLMDHSKLPAAEVKNLKGEAVRQPYMRTYAMVDVNRQITGRNESFLMENWYKPDNAPSSREFKNESEMRDVLRDAKARGQFPLILAVHTGNEPFKSDGRGAAGVWHVVCITDFDPTSDRVSVDNAWGKHSDHFGRNGVHVARLFRATVAPGTSMQQNLMRRSLEHVVIDGEPPQD